jgi:hypothetical protein
VIRREDFVLSYASSNEPDAIGVEISSRIGDDVLFDLWIREDGCRSMVFARVEGQEFDAAGLHELITDCFIQLDEWAANLRKPGGAWSNECGDNQL